MIPLIRLLIWRRTTTTWPPPPPLPFAVNYGTSIRSANGRRRRHGKAKCENKRGVVNELGKEKEVVNPKSRSDYDWITLRKMWEKKREKEWKLKTEGNKFVRNVGVASTLKLADLDPESPDFERWSEIDSPLEAEEAIEQQMDESLKFKKKIDEKFEPLSPEQIKRIMTFKKDKDLKPIVNPNLLTWMEKETIKHLNKSDPVQWTPHILSEAFPSATPKIIRKILKNDKRMSPDFIREHDKIVANNWKILSKGGGDLPMTKDLKEHLIKNNGVKQLSQLSSAQITSLQNEVIENYRKSLEPPKPKLDGKFGSLIADYNIRKKALEQQTELSNDNKNPNNNVLLNEEHMIDIKTLFDPNQKIFGEGEINMPSPYRDTALLNSGINIQREKPMTIEDFKNKYIKPLINNDIEEDSNLLAVKSDNPKALEMYKSWLREEARKDSQMTKPKLLNLNEIDEEIKDIKKNIKK